MVEHMTPEKMSTVRKTLADAMLDTAVNWLAEVEIDETSHRVCWLAAPNDEWVVHLEDPYDATRQTSPDFQITVLVEPIAQWRMGTWAEVTEGDRVRLAGQVATVQHAVMQHWHVDPRSSSYRPVPLEHQVVRVILADRGAYSFPPDGQVEISTGGPVGPAVAALTARFDLNEIKEQS